jgi:uncharacterized protein YaiI (UPF0178 family)
VVKVAQRHGLVVTTFVSNGGLRPSRDPMIRNVVVSKGADAADDWIVENAAANDVAVTADVPLAARLVPKGVHVLGPTGRPFTPESIGMAVGDARPEAALARDRRGPAASTAASPRATVPNSCRRSTGPCGGRSMPARPFERPPAR